MQRFPIHGVKTVTVLLGNGKDNLHWRRVRHSMLRAVLITHESRPRISNGDKKPDIAVDSWEKISTRDLSQTVMAQFQTPGMKFEAGENALTIALRRADMNADGNADIVTSNFEAGSVSVLGSATAAVISTRKDFPAPLMPFGIAIRRL